MKKWVLFICMLTYSIIVEAQGERIHILKQIESLQTINSKDFPNGAFPSYRKYQYGSSFKADYNLFYTALTIYNIERYRSFLSNEELSILANIKSKALPYFELFKNKKNNLTYNFWPKYHAEVFPNGGWLNNFNKMNALPDDIDDCSILMLALGNQDSLVGAMKIKFLDFINTKNKKSKGFYRKYKNDPVYSTWLGNGYPIDIDISVLSNVLLMNYSYQQNLNKNDTASLNLIIDLLKTNKHLTDPHYASQHYSNSATIIYHITRLMQYSNYEPLLKLKPILLEQSKALLIKSQYDLEKLLLINSIMQLGEQYDKTEINGTYNDLNMGTNDYPYFVANMTAILNNPFKRFFAATKLGRFSYYSNAFNLSLLFEYEILKTKLNTSIN